MASYNIQILPLLTIIGQRPTVVDRRNPSLSRSFRFYGPFIRSLVACRYWRETCTVFSSLRFICVSVCLDWRPRFLYSSSSSSSRPQRCPTCMPCVQPLCVCVFSWSFGGKSSGRHRGMFSSPHWRTDQLVEQNDGVPCRACVPNCLSFGECRQSILDDACENSSR